MKVIDMPNGKNEMIAAIENLKRHQSEMMEIIAISAQFKFHAFGEYMKAGFTAEQAVELCKASVIQI